VFLNPLFLIGAASAGVPVLIHLMHRRHTSTIEWPSLKFLLASHRRTSRRRQVEEILLLVLRAGLLALVSVALARPVLRAGGLLGEGAECAIALVLDNSMSMSARRPGAQDPEATRFALAKASALEILQGAPRGSRLALRLADGTEPPSAGALSPNREAVEAALRSAQVSDARGEMLAQVARAIEDLRKSPAARLELYCLTDLQATAFGREAKLGPGGRPVSLVFVDCGESPVQGVLVASATARAMRPVARVPFAVEVRLKSHAPIDVERKVVLEIDGEAPGGGSGPVSERLVKLAPGGTVSFAFQLALERAGERTGRVRLSPTDDLPADDVRHFRIHLAERIPVFVVERSPSAVERERPSFFVSLALAPGGASPLVPKVVRPEELASRTASDLLRESPVAVLVDLAAPSEREAVLWTEYVRLGGALVVFPSESHELAPAAQVLARAAGESFLPAEPGEVRGDARSRSSVRRIDVEHVDFQHEELLSAFRDLEPTLKAVSVWRAYDLRTQGVPQARTVLPLDGGGALLAARRFGDGEVYLFAVPAGAGWSDLPARALFLPLVHSIVHRVAAPREQERSFLAGSSPRIPLPLEAAGRPVRLVDPDGRRRELVPRPVESGRVELELPPLVRAGVWRLEPEQGAGTPLALVVNPDPEESDPARVGIARLRELYAGAASAEPVVVTPAGLARAVARVRKGLELWDAVFAAALGLALFESFFSNRLAAGSRRSTAAP